jgi:hypothetical protein
MTYNHFASAAIRGLGFERDAIEIEYELFNLSPGPVMYTGIAVFMTRPGVKLRIRFIGGSLSTSLLPPGQRLSRKERFVREEFPCQERSDGPSMLEVSWTFAIKAHFSDLGPMFSLTVTETLRDSEAKTVRGTI